MYSSFLFSMENIPSHKSFACLSLKIGCIVSALVFILHSVLSLAQCTAALDELARHLSADDLQSMLMFGMVIIVTIVYAITLFLTAIMLVGTLREKPKLMSPWVVWISIQLVLYLLLFVFWSTTSVINRGGTSILSYALEFLILLLRFYMLMVVASYYKQLQEEQYDGERLKTLVGKESWYNSA